MSRYATDCAASTDQSVDLGTQHVLRTALDTVAPEHVHAERVAEGTTSPAARLTVWLGWIVPVGFYLATVSRSPGWVDAALIARTVYHLDLSTWVNHHNLFTIIGYGWLSCMPDIDPHAALNVLCAVLGASTVYVVFWVGLVLTRRVFPSALGALVLMVSHTLWWHSTMLEVYTLSTLLMALTLLFVVRYDDARRFNNLAVAVFLWGLACSNHIQMGLLVFGFVALLLHPRVRDDLGSVKSIVTLGACFVLGFQTYLWVFSFQFYELIDSRMDPGRALAWMVHNTTGGEFKELMFPDGLSVAQRAFWFAYYAGLFVYNFPPPWLLFAPFGMVAWWKRSQLRASWLFFAAALLVQVVWSSNYFVSDMHAFALPSYVLTGVLVIVGVDWVLQRGLAWRRLVYVLSATVVAIPLLYQTAPRWLSSNDGALSFFKNAPQYDQITAFWNPWAYFLNPNKRAYDTVARYSAAIIDEMDLDSCFWGNEATIFYPLKFYYQEVLGEREDVTYELVFGMLHSATETQRQAQLMRRQLAAGCAVYVTSLGYPERGVLDLVYHGLDNDKSLAAITSLSPEALIRTFPVYKPTPIVIDERHQVRVFKLVPRE